MHNGYAWLEDSVASFVQHTLNNHCKILWKYTAFHKNGLSQNLSICPSIDTRFLELSVASQGGYQKYLLL